MSLSWRDRMGIALYPDRLVIARVGGVLRPCVKEHDATLLEPARAGDVPWQPAVAALAERVAGGQCKGASVSLVLSSRFVRYVLIPWNDALSAEDEQLAYARERCRALHGPEADRWVLHAGPAVRGASRVACAVDAALLASLEDAMRPLKARYRSVQPHLMACFNRWRTRTSGRPEWFVVHEPGLLSVGLLCKGQWQSLRSVKVGAEWHERLAGLLTREQCVTELADPVTRVLLVAESDEEMPTTEPWEIDRLQPQSGGAAAGTAAAYAAWIPA